MPLRKLIVDSDLEMRELSINDAQAIFTTIDTQRDYLRQWLPFVDSTNSPNCTVLFIKSVMKRAAENGELGTAIYYKNEFAGVIGFKDTDFTHQRTEIGYWLSQPFQGKGIINRCCKKLVEFAFAEYKMNRVQLKIATENFKSQKVAKALGFTYEGTERDGELLVNGFADLMLFSLLKREWKP